MSKPFILVAALAGVLGGTACQSHVGSDQPTADTSAAAPAEEETPAVLTSHKTGAGTTPLAPSTLPAADQAFLRQHNPATLWQLSNSEYAQSMNGAYGADHYRIEFVFTSVEQDAKRPDVYHVRGKDRYKKTILPFTGDIVLTKLHRRKQYADGSVSTPWYSAEGTFELRELGSASAGAFRGKTALDFNINDEGAVYIAPYEGEKPLARGGGALFEGQWTNARGTVKKPVLWAHDFLQVGDEVLQDFVVGERDASVNPKYAKLGWDHYWENDEWWAEPAKTASL